MEGISAVSARISEIRALVHPVHLARTAPTALSAAPVSAAPAAPYAVPGFAGALAQALQTAPAPSAAAAPSAPSVAALQATYRNGRIPAEALMPIGVDGHRLAAPAAEAFTRLLAAAQQDGVTIGVTDSYRSFDAQVDVARRKGLYSQGGLAAEPGTSSHGWGLAVDLDLDARAQTWMRTHGARFGFVEDTPREPWHWAFQA